MAFRGWETVTCAWSGGGLGGLSEAVLGLAILKTVRMRFRMAMDGFFPGQSVDCKQWRSLVEELRHAARI